MSARWLAPVFALAALVGSTDRLTAKDGDYLFEFSTDPAKPQGIPNLEVRPNTAQPFYLFLRNKTDFDHDVRVQILASDQKTVLAEGTLKKVKQHTDAKPVAEQVPLAKPAAGIGGADADGPAAAPGR
jgi:hypothetical protein